MYLAWVQRQSQLTHFWGSFQILGTATAKAQPPFLKEALTEEWDRVTGKQALMILRECMDEVYLPHMQVWKHLRLWTQTVSLYTGLCNAEPIQGCQHWCNLSLFFFWILEYCRQARADWLTPQCGALQQFSLDVTKSHTTISRSHCFKKDFSLEMVLSSKNQLLIAVLIHLSNFKLVCKSIPKWENLFLICASIKELKEPKLSFSPSINTGRPKNMTSVLDLYNSNKLWDMQ